MSKTEIIGLKMKSKQELLSDTLKLVNKFRASLGVESLNSLPKGKIKDGRACPLYKALPGCIIIDEGVFEFKYPYDDLESIQDLFDEYSFVTSHNGIWTVDTPSTFDSFISLFDSGEYPELIEE
jgi:hypothetical protein